MKITIDNAAIKALANDPRGQIARELTSVASKVVEPVVREALSIPATYTTNDRGWKIWVKNAPGDGPPRRRSGLLVRGIGHSPPEVDPLGLRVDVTSSPQSHYDYLGQSLIPRGYIFVSRGDGRFKIVARQPGQ